MYKRKQNPNLTRNCFIKILNILDNKSSNFKTVLQKWEIWIFSAYTFGMVMHTYGT